MAYDFDGIDDYVQTVGPALYAPPITLSCWFNVDVVPTAARCLCALSETTVGGAGGTTANHSVMLLATSNNFVTARASVNNGNNSSTTTNQWTAGTWSHALGLFATSSNRIPCLDGVIGTNSAGTRAAINLDCVLVGRNSGGTYSGNLPLNGKVAEVAVWTATLTESEIVALSKGAKPTSIRPTDLAFYLPLVREIGDVCNVDAVTASGAVASIHPRRYG